MLSTVKDDDQDILLLIIWQKNRIVVGATLCGRPLGNTS